MIYYDKLKEKYILKKKKLNRNHYSFMQFNLLVIGMLLSLKARQSLIYQQTLHAIALQEK